MDKTQAGKILIVDDTQENIALLSKILEKKGYQILAANNGERAIKIARKLKPDLILIDIMMPGINGLEINIHFQPECIDNKISFDAVRIGQVITNFLSNAIKFTPKGKNIDILISKYDAKLSKFSSTNPSSTPSIIPSTHVSIRNYGVTIPQEELEHIFEQFSQSSIKISNVGGTGLGLSISKEIIKAHAGEIWLENHPDGGVAANFIIPNEFIES